MAVTNDDELTPAQKLAAKLAIDANAQPTGEEKGLSAPVPDTLAAQPGNTGDTADTQPLAMGQGPNANGAAESQRQVLAEGSHELGGVKKITREELIIDPQSEQPEHVVQQGGGGVVRPSGEPISPVGTTAEALTPTEPKQ